MSISKRPWAVYLDKTIADLKERQLYRCLPTIDKGIGAKVFIGDLSLWDFASNDYLGLSRDLPLLERVFKDLLFSHRGLGGRASRLLSGNQNYFREIEKQFAALRKKEDCLFFPSGYQANVTVISALADSQTIIIADKLVHASIIDGIRLAGVKFFRYRHNDLNHLKDLLERTRNRFPHRKVIVITESLFSMEGDFAPLKEIANLCLDYEAIFYVDEAHSVGVWDDVDSSCTDVLVGTFGKAFGLWGAYVCGSYQLIEYLINKGRGFIFSTCPSAVLFTAVAQVMALLEDKEFKLKIIEYKKKIRHFHNSLQGIGISSIGKSQIVPIVVGDVEKAKRISGYLYKRGFFVPAIRPPTVAPNSSRIRCSITLLHPQEALDGLIDSLKDFLFDGSVLLQ